MAMARRIGTETSETRARLLDATEQIMLEDGYAAVSSRSVAGRVGVKAPLVHYYFPTLDDLFIAAFRRRSEHNLERLTEALQGDEPLQALWEYARDRTGTVLTQEFIALANHRKTIRAEIAEVAERFRKVQMEALSSVQARTRLDPNAYPPAGLLLIMMSVPMIIALEENLGMSYGHDEATMIVQRHLEEFQTPARSPRSTAKTAKTTSKARSTKAAPASAKRRRS